MRRRAPETVQQFDARALRAKRLSAIAIVLEAESIQRKDREEFRLSAHTVADRANIPVEIVQQLGRDHFASVRVDGRVVGYSRGEFYVADDERTGRVRSIGKILTNAGSEGA